MYICLYIHTHTSPSKSRHPHHYLLPDNLLKAHIVAHSFWPSIRLESKHFSIDHEWIYLRVAVSCSELQWVAVSCSVLQCVSVLPTTNTFPLNMNGFTCVLQWVAVSCSELQWVAVSCSVLQCVAVSFSPTYHKHLSIEHEQIYLRVAVSCSELQCVAVCCSVLQCVAVRCLETMITFVQTYFYWHCSHELCIRVVLCEWALLCG